MAENAGRIEYHFIGNTQELLKSEDVAIDSTNRVTKALDKQDKAVDKNRKDQRELSKEIDKTTASTQKNKNMVNEFNATQKKQADYTQKSAAGLNQITQGIRTYALGVHGADKAVEMMVKELRDLEIQAQRTNKPINQTPKSLPAFNDGLKETAKNSSLAKANLGQAGIQVQQFVGQLQGGQSAMVALAQQSADLGIVLGAPLVGVFVSLAAVLAGTLLPAVFSSTSAIEKMEKAVENTKAVLTLGAYGVANYSDELKTLSTISQELVRIKLNTAMAEQQKVIQNVGEAAKQAYKDAIPLFNWSFDNSATSTLFGNLVNDKDLERLGSADPLITKARTGIEKLVNAMRTIEKGNTTRGVEQLTDSIDFLSASAVQNTKAGSDLVLQMTKIVEQYKVGKLTIDQLKEALDKSKEGLSGNSGALQSFLQEMHISNTAMLEGERAAIKLKLQYDGLEESEVKAALASYDYNKSLKDQKEAAEESAKAIKSVNNELDAFFDKESKQSTAKDDRERGQAESFAQGIIDKGMTEPERFAAELEKLEELRQKGLLSQQLYDQAIVASVENRGNELDKINATQEAMQNRQRELLLTSTSDVFGGIADILRNSQGEQSDAYKAMFALSKGFAIANAGLNLSLAISQALADPSALTIYQKFANYAAIASAGGALISSISGMNYSGGRQYGGAVSNGMYRVNETGIPEIRSYGGKDYLMETQNAQIKPLDKIGGEMNVVINNNAPGVDVSASQVNQRTVEISVRKSMQEFANQAASGQGEAINSLIRNTNVTRKGGV